MAYHHPSYTAGHKNDSPAYALSSAGDVAAVADYMTKADLPGYTTRFYSPSEQEQFSDVKYDKLLVNYDKDFGAVREAFKGAPIEAYIPRSMAVIEGGGFAPVEAVKEKPSKKIAEEIEQAQRKAKEKEAIVIDTVVDELIIKRRRVRKRKVIAKR